MEIHVKHYSVDIDCTLYGIKEKDNFEYDVSWDAPCGDPNNFDLWFKQKENLIYEIESAIRAGKVPFVAVFLPSKRIIKVIEKGKRVRLSAYALEHKINPRNQQRQGVVIGYSRDSRCVRVHWDGNSISTTGTYHVDFLDEVDSNV